VEGSKNLLEVVYFVEWKGLYGALPEEIADCIVRCCNYNGAELLEALDLVVKDKYLVFMWGRWYSKSVLEGWWRERLKEICNE